MRSIDPWPLAHAHIIERPGGAKRGAVTEIKRAFNRLLRLARANWIFAITEISKGVAIVAIGDMVIAEDLGEVVRIAATGLPEMRVATRERATGLARASGRWWGGRV